MLKSSALDVSGIMCKDLAIVSLLIHSLLCEAKFSTQAIKQIKFDVQQKDFDWPSISVETLQKYLERLKNVLFLTW